MLPNAAKMLVNFSLTYGKELANLAKLYTDKSKYSGKNNNFNFKLTIFIDLY
jgi:hypothetical protein